MDDKLLQFYTKYLSMGYESEQAFLIAQAELYGEEKDRDWVLGQDIVPQAEEGF